MALSESHEEIMEVLVQFITDTKSYVDDVSVDTPDFSTYLEQIELSELETYLLNKMTAQATFIESAVLEAYNFVRSWQRDNISRRMSRAEYFEDASLSLENDIEYLRGLKELQKQYILGSTPQQRS